MVFSQKNISYTSLIFYTFIHKYCLDIIDKLLKNIIEDMNINNKEKITHGDIKKLLWTLIKYYFLFNNKRWI